MKVFEFVWYMKNFLNLIFDKDVIIKKNDRLVWCMKVDVRILNKILVKGM